MGEFKIYIPGEQIGQKIDELASRIREDYREKHPLLVGALKGSFIFMSDLVRALDIPLEIDFISVSSYGAGTTTSGKIELRQDLKTPAENRHILLIEDIIDTGLTSSFLLEILKSKKPLSLKLCTLLDKPSRREVEVPVDYVGFTVPDKFIVGYGLDYNQQHRYLPDICLLEE